MRILVTTWNAGLIGGAERYIESVVNALQHAGHAVACLFELGAEPGKPPIRVSDGIPTWTYAANGRAFAEAGDWHPDVVYSHGFLTASLDARLPALAPTVFFAHNYYGTCISGTKTWTRPVPQACDRVFGWGCFTQYYSRRCGGLNPLVMWRQFDIQRTRGLGLADTRAILVASRHMLEEFRRHASTPEHVRLLPLPFTSRVDSETPELAGLLDRRLAGFTEGKRPVRLLYLGRLETNKGAEVAVVAASRIADRLDRDVELAMVGDGSARSCLQDLPAGRANVRFTGWLAGSELDAELASPDLLLFPSLWPEPFGLAGLEAAAYGVPAAAFAHGGVTDWLNDGANGRLAPADPPTVDGFVEAACECLASPETLSRLSRGAMVKAADWPTVAEHVVRLTAILGEAVSRR